MQARRGVGGVVGLGYFWWSVSGRGKFWCRLEGGHRVVPLAVTGVNRTGAVGEMDKGSRAGHFLTGLKFIPKTRIVILSTVNNGIVIGVGSSEITMGTSVTHRVVV